MKFWRKEEKWYTVSTHAMYKTFLAADINTAGATEEKKRWLGTSLPTQLTFSIQVGVSYVPLLNY